LLRLQDFDLYCDPDAHGGGVLQVGVITEISSKSIRDKHMFRIYPCCNQTLNRTESNDCARSSLGKAIMVDDEMVYVQVIDTAQ
jgi:hypothetical protein